MLTLNVECFVWWKCFMILRMTTITGTFLMVHFCRNGMERDETFVTTFVTNHNTGGWHLIDPVPLPILLLFVRKLSWHSWNLNFHFETSSFVSLGPELWIWRSFASTSWAHGALSARVGTAMIGSKRADYPLKINMDEGCGMQQQQQQRWTEDN